MDDALKAMADEIQAGEPGIEGDQRFHDAVLEAAHNPILAKVVAQLTDAFSRTSAASLSTPDQPAKSLADHHRILDAIKSGDERAAAEEMLGHLQRTTESRKQVANALSQVSPSTDVLALDALVARHVVQAPAVSRRLLCTAGPL
jgi:DNA-binding FadR family transcriptional regulator